MWATCGPWMWLVVLLLPGGEHDDGHGRPGLADLLTHVKAAHPRQHQVQQHQIRVLLQGGQHLDEDEFLDVVTMPFDQLVRQVMDGVTRAASAPSGRRAWSRATLMILPSKIVVTMPFDQLVRQVMDGVITDGKTVSATLKAKVLLGL